MNEFKRKWQCCISSGLCFRISRERGNAFAFVALGAIAFQKHEAFAEKPIYVGVGGAIGLDVLAGKGGMVSVLSLLLC